MRSEGTFARLGAQVVRQSSHDTQNHDQYHNLGCGRCLVVFFFFVPVPLAELIHVATVILFSGHGFLCFELRQDTQIPEMQRLMKTKNAYTG
jgi:hypothetical protein